MPRSHDECLAYLEQIRWNGTPICPYCTSTNSTATKADRRYHCNNCFTSYSVTVGTLFHKTHLDLQKWFLAISLILNTSGKKITARQIAREVEVNKNTASYLLIRICSALNDDKELLQKLADFYNS